MPFGLFVPACSAFVVLRDPTSYPACLWVWRTSCCSKKHLHSLVFSYNYLTRHDPRGFPSTLIASATFRDFCLGTTLGSGDVWCHIHYICWCLVVMASLGIAMPQRPASRYWAALLVLKEVPIDENQQKALTLPYQYRNLEGLMVWRAPISLSSWSCFNES